LLATYGAQSVICTRPGCNQGAAAYGSALGVLGRLTRNCQPRHCVDPLNGSRCCCHGACQPCAVCTALALESTDSSITAASCFTNCSQAKVSQGSLLPALQVMQILLAALLVLLPVNLLPSYRLLSAVARICLVFIQQPCRPRCLRAACCWPRSLCCCWRGLTSEPML
jgi:hypothetical protein